jgi:hypothetical protein
VRAIAVFICRCGLMTFPQQGNEMCTKLHDGVLARF